MIATPETSVPTVQIPPRKRWTRRDCDLAEKAGVFDGQRYELIEGELIDKMGANPPHSALITRLIGWVCGVFGHQHVRVQSPIDVSPEDNPTSQPQPDLCVTELADDQYEERDPQASEIRLLIEVSDSTLTHDLTVKAGLYARAGIAEYWVVEAGPKRFWVHRSPSGGRYQEVVAYRGEETFAPLAAPESRLRPAAFGRARG